MPLVNVQTADPREMGRQLSAYVWGPLVVIDLRDPGSASIKIRAQIYNSVAAATDGESIPTEVEFLVTGQALRDLLLANAATFLAVTNMIDGELLNRMGSGQLYPPTVPAWFSEPFDPQSA